MSKTLEAIHGLNLRLEQYHRQGERCGIEINAKPLALVHSIDPLAYERYNRFKRPRIIGNFAVRSFATSTHPIHSIHDTYGIYPILGLAGSLYMFAFNTPDLHTILRHAGDTVDYPVIASE